MAKIISSEIFTNKIMSLKQMVKSWIIRINILIKTPKITQNTFFDDEAKSHKNVNPAR